MTGIALFATILYIPLYQQIARGYSPTKSGLLIIPLVAGMMVASITSGRIITKYGRYKLFPIIGTVLLGTGIWLFSHVGLTTSQTSLSIWMVIIGLGLGSFLQVPTLAVQNAINPKQMGTATSATSFFRSIGSALGGAIFGSILIARLNIYLKQLLPHSVSNSRSLNAKALESGNNFLKTLPPSIRHDILAAYVHSFHDMFLIGVPFVAAAFITALILRETPLRGAPGSLPSKEVLDIESHSPIEI